MTDIKRETLNVLAEVWALSPDVRLGQLTKWRLWYGSPSLLRRYSMRTILALSLVAGVALAGEQPDAAKDRERLQGLWQAVSLEANGEKAPAEQAERFQLHFKDGKVVFNPKADNREHAYHIDPAVKPKALDITPGDGEKKGQRLPCAIYDLAGDRLILCIDKEGEHGKRPAEFKTKAGDGLVLITLERARQPR